MENKNIHAQTAYLLTYTVTVRVEAASETEAIAQGRSDARYALMQAGAEDYLEDIKEDTELPAGSLDENLN